MQPNYKNSEENTFHIAICDDEQIQIDRIKNYLSRFNSSMELVVKQFLNGKEIIDSYKKGNKFDIIYLDIRMAPLNGIEAAKILRLMDENVIIIFITSLIEYAIQGYEVQAFHYLIKPLSHKRFDKVFIRACKKVSGRRGDFYLIKNRNELTKLEVGNIVYIESFGRKVSAHTEHQIYEHYSNISDEEKNLCSFGFIRVHKSFLVNMKYIEQLQSTKILLKNGRSIPLSKNRYKYAYDEFTKFLVGCLI